jgi:hypothetical protein
MMQRQVIAANEEYLSVVRIIRRSILGSVGTTKRELGYSSWYRSHIIREDRVSQMNDYLYWRDKHCGLTRVPLAHEL